MREVVGSSPTATTIFQTNIVKILFDITLIEQSGVSLRNFQQQFMHGVVLGLSSQGYAPDLPPKFWTAAFMRSVTFLCKAWWC